MHDDIAMDVFRKLSKKVSTGQCVGRVTVSCGNIDNHVLTCKDTMGIIIQELVECFLRQEKISYLVNPNTQMPPDFFLHPDDMTHGLFEIKAFDLDRKPAFDIAPYATYMEEIVKKPYVLDTDYCIFGYRVHEDGHFSLDEVWLKNVWEITSPTPSKPLPLQIKRGVVHKIRPANWAKHPDRCFKDKESFIAACVKALDIDKSDTVTHDGEVWLQEFAKAYETYYGKQIVIPAC